MANRRFEMYQYRQVLFRMRLGDTDRAIARAGLMGRRKLGGVRRVAEAAGWLDPAVPLPDDAELSRRLEMPIPKVRKVLRIAQEPISLETPVGEEEESHLGDFIVDKRVISLLRMLRR